MKIQRHVRHPFVGSRYLELLLPVVAALRPLPVFPGEIALFPDEFSFGPFHGLDQFRSKVNPGSIRGRGKRNPPTPSPISGPIDSTGSGMSAPVFWETVYCPDFGVTVALLRSPEICRESWSLPHPTLGRKIRGRRFLPSGTRVERSSFIWRGSGYRRESPQPLRLHLGNRFGFVLSRASKRTRSRFLRACCRGCEAPDARKPTRRSNATGSGLGQVPEGQDRDSGVEPHSLEVEGFVPHEPDAPLMSGQKVLLFLCGTEPESEGLTCFHGSYSTTEHGMPYFSALKGRVYAFFDKEN